MVGEVLHRERVLVIQLERLLEIYYRLRSLSLIREVDLEFCDSQSSQSHRVVGVEFQNMLEGELRFW